MVINKEVTYYFVSLIHLFIIVAAYVSPFLLNWKIVLIGVLIYVPFSAFMKYCPLTRLQFGSTKHSFNWYYLNKVGINISEKKLDIYLRYIVPLAVFLIAVLWQVILKKGAILIL